MNVKKLFPEKKISKKGLIEFLDKKGFYIVLIICIAVVGVTAVFLSTRGLDSTSSDNTKIIPELNEALTDNNAISNEGKNPISEAASNIPGTTTPGKTNSNPAITPNNKTNTTPANDNKTQKSTEKKTDTKKPAATPANIKFIMPVFGEVTFGFSEDELVFSRTLDEWRYHSGIDIAAERGTVVKAVADGVVTEIDHDPGYGITIIIDHMNGMKTVYSNLASDDTVTTNQKVKKGDVIGAIGNTATFESSEQSHLHFEVRKNNVPVNPLNYLPKTK